MVTYVQAKDSVHACVLLGLSLIYVTNAEQKKEIGIVSHKINFFQYLLES